VRAVVAERARAALEPSGRSLSHEAIDQSKRLEALKQVDVASLEAFLAHWPAGPGVQLTTEQDTASIPGIVEHWTDLGQGPVNRGIRELVQQPVKGDRCDLGGRRDLDRRGDPGPGPRIRERNISLGPAPRGSGIGDSLTG
jgi:hypothetical protein